LVLEYAEVATFPRALVSAAVADSIQPVQTTCQSELTIPQSAPLAET
jgi:hypothetical protein